MHRIFFIGLFALIAAGLALSVSQVTAAPSQTMIEFLDRSVAGAGTDSYDPSGSAPAIMLQSEWPYDPPIVPVPDPDPVPVDPTPRPQPTYDDDCLLKEGNPVGYQDDCLLVEYWAD